MNPRSSVLDQMNTTADAPTLDISAKKSSFKRQQDSLSEIAHLVENCNNGLCFERLNFAERYLAKRLHVRVKLCSRSTGDDFYLAFGIRMPVFGGHINHAAHRPAKPDVGENGRWLEDRRGACESDGLTRSSGTQLFLHQRVVFRAVYPCRM